MFDMNAKNWSRLNEMFGIDQPALNGCMNISEDASENVVWYCSAQGTFLKILTSLLPHSPVSFFSWMDFEQCLPLSSPLNNLFC